MLTKSTHSYLSSVGNPTLKSAVVELNERGFDTSAFSARLDAYESQLNTPSFQVEADANSAALTSFLFCFSTAKKRAVAVKTAKEEENKRAEDADNRRGREAESVVVTRSIRDWSAEWVKEGNGETAENVAARYSAFDESALSQFIDMCLYRQAAGDHGAQRKWAAFGIDYLAHAISEVTEDFKNKCSIIFINGVQLCLPKPQELMAMKGTDGGTEAMIKRSKWMDTLDAAVAASSLILLHDSIESDLNKCSTAENRASIFVDAGLVGRRLRWVTSSLALFFSYYVPRLITSNATRTTIPKHSIWNELLDYLCSDSIVSFVDVIQPDLMEYFYVMSSILRRRYDVSDPIIAHAHNNTVNPSPYSGLLVALHTQRFDTINELLDEMPTTMGCDLFLGMYATELIEQFRLGSFEQYYKIRRAIDQDGAVTAMDVKMLASRLRTSESNQPTISGETQQLMVRASYLINQLEKESEKHLTSMGL